MVERREFGEKFCGDCWQKKKATNNSHGVCSLDPQQNSGFITQTLGFNLEGRKRQDKGKGILLISEEENEDMKEDSEKLSLENVEGKKRLTSSNHVQG